MPGAAVVVVFIVAFAIKTTLQMRPVAQADEVRIVDAHKVVKAVKTAVVRSSLVSQVVSSSLDIKYPSVI